MIEFDSVQNYLLELGENPDLAVVSRGMAAKSRGVSVAAIDRMIVDGRITGLQVPGSRCVLAKDLIDLLEQEKARRATVRQILEKLARQKTSGFYDCVMAPVGLSTRRPPDRKVIGSILGEISRETYEEKGLLLSVLVHKKTAGKTRPGKGFFELADSLGISYADHDAFIEEQTKLVFECYTVKKTRRQ